MTNTYNLRRFMEEVVGDTAGTASSNSHDVHDDDYVYSMNVTTTTTTYEAPSLSDFQDTLLSIIPIIPSIASIIGSFFIIISIMTSKTSNSRGGKKTTLSTTLLKSSSTKSIMNTENNTNEPITTTIIPTNILDRLLLGMSCCLFVCSCMYPMSVFLLPHTHDDETIHRNVIKHLSFGNYYTCTILGFFSQFLFSTFLYITMISYYYLLKIKYSWTDEEQFRKYYYIEYCMHTISIGYPLLTAIIGIINEFYDELRYDPTTCWISRDTYSKSLDYNIEWIFIGSIIVFIFTSLFINTIMLYGYVHKVLYRRGGRYNTNHSDFEEPHQIQRYTSLSTSVSSLSSFSIDDDYSTDTYGISNDTIAVIGHSACFNTNNNNNNTSLSTMSSITEKSPSIFDSYYSRSTNNNTNNNTMEDSRRSSATTSSRSATTAGRKPTRLVKFSSGPSSLSTITTNNNNTTTNQNQQQQQQAERIIQLESTQAFFYISLFFICCIWTCIIRLIELFGPDIHDFHIKSYTTLFGFIIPLLYCQSFFLPLQGFFTFCIYIRPIYIQIRKVYPQESSYWAIQRSIYGEDKIVPSYLVIPSTTTTNN